MSVRIIGTGSYLPKKVADNNFLSTIVDTDDEWIRQRTGIKERHLSNGKEGTTYMAAHAAEAALENAGIGADELDMIIVATVSADTYVPSTSCSVQGAIGAIRATCFDINAACSGFLFALNTAYAYIEMGMAKTVLVAGAETLSQANVRILELIAKRLKVDIDKFPMNLDRYGNTSSASIPILLDELNRNHLLERGDKIILSGFGGGLTWGAMLIEW